MAPLSEKSALFLASPTSVESSLPFRSLKINAMSSSSRAKFYRRRIRHKTRRLEHDGRQLQRQMRNLEIVLRVQRHLTSRLPRTTMRQRILAHIGDFIIHAKFLKGLELHRHELSVDSVECYGPTDACVVRLNTTLRGSYDKPTIDRLYAAVPGNTTLLDHFMHERMAFPCSFLFAFSAEGAIEFETVETEFVRGIVSVCRNPSDVRALLVRRQAARTVDAEQEMKKERNT